MVQGDEAASHAAKAYDSQALRGKHGDSGSGRIEDSMQWQFQFEPR